AGGAPGRGPAHHGRAGRVGRATRDGAHGGRRPGPPDTRPEPERAARPGPAPGHRATAGRRAGPRRALGARAGRGVLPGRAPLRSAGLTARDSVVYWRAAPCTILDVGRQQTTLSAS